MGLDRTHRRDYLEQRALPPVPPLQRLARAVKYLPTINCSPIADWPSGNRRPPTEAVLRLGWTFAEPHPL